MKVLIVEDYPDQALALSIAIKRSKKVTEVVECARLDCALKAIFDEEVKFVLLDLMLPDGDGERILEVMKEHNLKVRAMVISAVPYERLHALSVLYPEAMVLPKSRSVDLVLNHFDYLISVHE